MVRPAREFLAGLLLAAVPAARAYEPQVNYQLQCMGCHLADGSGVADRVPSVRRTLMLFSASPEGRRYLLQVPGVAQSALSDEETAEVLNWMMRTLSDLPLQRDIAPYTAPEVGRFRHQPLAEVGAIRARLLKSADAGMALPNGRFR